MKIEEFSHKMNELIAEIAQKSPAIVQTIAVDAIAMIRNRIQEKGQKASGEQLPGYSEKEVPAFFYFNKATNSAGRAIIKERQKEKRGLSYKDFKAANNGADSVKVKNLTFTGAMFRALAIKSQGVVGGKYQVVIGGTNPDSQDRINWNSDDYGDILDLSKQEREEIKETYHDEIARIIKSKGF